MSCHHHPNGCSSYLWRHNYHLPTNVFSHVCLSHVTITHDVLDLIIQGIHPSLTGITPAGNIWRQRLDGDLFKLLDMRDTLVVISGYIWWVSKQYTSYWNTFQLILFCHCYQVRTVAFVALQPIHGHKKILICRCRLVRIKSNFTNSRSLRNGKGQLLAKIMTHWNLEIHFYNRSNFTS